MNIRNVLNFFKSEEQLGDEMSIKEIVPILKQKLVDAKENDEVVVVKITGIKQKGFQVKVKGIYAFVPFSLMPMKYPVNIWQFLKNEFIGAQFFAKIIEIDLEINRIILDARITEFEEFNLYDTRIYKALILIKSSKYIVVEIGHRFNWQFGSQCYLVQLDSPNSMEADYKIHSISDEIDLTYIKSLNNWIRVTFDSTVMQPTFISDIELVTNQKRQVSALETDELKNKIHHLEQIIQEFQTASVSFTKFEKAKNMLSMLMSTRHKYKALYHTEKHKSEVLYKQLREYKRQNYELDLRLVQMTENLINSQNFTVDHTLETLVSENKQVKQRVIELQNNLRIAEHELTTKTALVESLKALINQSGC